MFKVFHFQFISKYSFVLLLMNYIEIHMSDNRKRAILLIFFSSLIGIITLITINQNGRYGNADHLTNEVTLSAPPLASKAQSPLLEEKKDVRDSLVNFATKQLLVPYKYASCDPAIGFDCSGFVFYVFQHFNIPSPRTSSAFEKAGKKISLKEVQKGDILVFTGTDASIRKGGHVGIVLSVGDSIKFIHSSSGTANGVCISALEENHYSKRFLVARDLIGEGEKD